MDEQAPQGELTPKVIARVALTPALRGLRTHWGTAVLAALTGAAALAAALPIARLATWRGAVGSRLHLGAARPFDAGFLWLHPAVGPAEIRQIAVAALFRLLLGVAVAVAVVALFTLLALFVARASARASEIAVRRAVGASTRALVAAHLVEGGVISAAALLLGGTAGLVAGRVLVAAWPGSLGPAAGQPVLALTLVVAGATVLGALLPVAIVHRPARSTAVDPTPLALVVPAAQLGLSLTVLVAAAMLRSGARATARPGPETGAGARIYDIAAAAVPLPARAAGYAALLQRVKADDGATVASLTSTGALVGLGQVALATGLTPGFLAADSPFYAVHHAVSPDSFRALSLRVVAGRAFGEADDWHAPRVAVVNRAYAMHWGGVGATVYLGYGPDARHTVVGVVDDPPPLGLGATMQPEFVIYTSVLQHPPATAVLLLEGGSLAGRDLDGVVRAALGPGASASRPVSEASVLAREAAPLRWFAASFAVEGWAMLVIAMFGTFAVMWLWVTSLLGELGLMRASGASRRRVLRYVLARAAAVALWGTVFGAWVGMMVWDAIHSLAPTLPAWDPGELWRTALLLGAAALAGAFVPAWRASHAPPAELLAGGG